MVKLEDIREAICGNIAAWQVPSGYGQRVSIPFTDKYGDMVVLYIHKDGHLTDASEYLNELRAMGAIDDWYQWAGRFDFLERYNLLENGTELRPARTENPDDILAYIQGLGKITQFFDFYREAAESAKFIDRVRRITRKQLIQAHGGNDEERGRWAAERLKRKSLALPDDEYELELDVSPVDQHVLLQIVGYPDASASTQKRVIRDKTYPLVYAALWQQKNRQPRRFARVVVVPSLDEYNSGPQAMLASASDRIIQFENDGRQELVDALAVAGYRERVFSD